MIQIVVDLRRNVLRLQLTDRSALADHRVRVPAVLDIGERGALLGLELSLGESLTLPPPNRPSTTNPGGDAYLALSDETSPLARSARIDVDVMASDEGEIAEIVVPRRGSSFEISFPSGNQCWLPRRVGAGDRQPLGWCSVIEA